ncbi:MAG TPA: hypothetical protein PKA13_19365 [Geminicoccaceae bacterium]|nr:hypothetical protein [Geminicoccus sp.]HMU51944.1 hypothetical protein [Geminicoccaceae bacterium]
MAQIKKQDVGRVLGELEGLSDNVPALRPEDVDRIKAIAGEPDIGLRVQRMAALLDELESQFNRNAEELAGLQRSFGLVPGSARALLDSDQLTDDSRAELYGSIDAFTQRMMEEVKREARAAVGGSRSARPVRPGRLRV